MPTSALIGTRLRERRLAAGLRQADVAATAGISASYLNLIEHNRRRVGAEVLQRLAGALAIDTQGWRPAPGPTWSTTFARRRRACRARRPRSTGWRNSSADFRAGPG